MTSRDRTLMVELVDPTFKISVSTFMTPLDVTFFLEFPSCSLGNVLGRTNEVAMTITGAMNGTVLTLIRPCCSVVHRWSIPRSFYCV